MLLHPLYYSLCADDCASYFLSVSWSTTLLGLMSTDDWTVPCHDLVKTIPMVSHNEEMKKS